MKRTLLNISGKLDKSLIDIITEVQTISDSMNVKILLVGALARDVHFEYTHGFESARRTLDVDLAVMVNNFNEYNSLKSYLILDCGFTATNIIHRLKKNMIEVDLIPFGKNAFPLNKAKLEENAKEMDISAFEEVYNNSVEVILKEKPKLQIRIPDIPGLIILKLFSYHDNPDRRKDAEDIYFMMKYFEQTLDPAVFHTQYEYLLTKYEYDSKKISIAILGEQIKAILADDILKKLEQIIFIEIKEDSEYSLILKMRRHDDNSFEQILEFMKILYNGIK